MKDGGHALKFESQNSLLKWEYLQRTILLKEKKKQTCYTAFLIPGGTSCLTILRQATFSPQTKYFLKKENSRSNTILLIGTDTL